MGVIVGQLEVQINGDASNLSSSLNNIKSDGLKFTSSLQGNVSNLLSSFGGLGSGISVALTGAITLFDTIGNAIKSVGTNLTQYLTVPLAAASTAVFTFGKNFESEMSKVTGLVGVSTDQVDEWGTTILDLAPTIGQTPQNLAEGLFYVTSAGIKGAEAMEVLEMSGKAASAGLGETATIADLVTSAMNAYGSENLSASQATDILVAAVREGKAEASELAASMGQVLPIASEMGVSFDQVAAAQAAMTRTGTSASEASTQLKAIMSGLLKPSVQAEEALAGMGTSSAELRKSIKEKGLISTLGDLRTLTNKYGEDAMAKVFPNIRALSGVLDLMGSNADDNIEIFDSVADSTGSLDKAFQSAAETADFKWNQALSQLQSTAITFFDTLKVAAIPILKKLVEVLKWVSDSFNSLSPTMQKATLIFATGLAVLGPALTLIGTAISALIPTILGIATTFLAVTTSVILFGGIMAGIIAIISAVVVAIGGLVASFIKLYKSNAEFRKNVQTTWNKIKETAIDVFNYIKLIITKTFNKIKEFWDKHGETILNIFEKVWNVVLNIINDALTFIQTIIKSATAIINGDWETAWNLIKDLFAQKWEEIKTVFSTVFSILVNYAKQKFIELKDAIVAKLIETKNSIVEWFVNLPTMAAEQLELFKTSIKNKFGEIKEDILLKLEEWKQAIIEWFQTMPENLISLLESWKETLTNYFNEQNEENKKQFAIWWEAIKEWFTSIPEKIKAQLETWKETILNFYNETKEKISTKLNEWWETIKTWFSNAPGKIKGFLNNWWSTMAQWYENAKAKIKTKLEGWWQTIKSWFSSVPEKSEIKNSGSKMVDKIAKGAKDKKSDFTEKLGKLIVDVALAALAVAAVTLVATGREIVKRIISGVGTVSLKSAGQKIVKSLLSGIKSMYSNVSNVCYSLASKIRDFFPFSPAKVGPLKDIDKMDFGTSIAKSINKSYVDVIPSVGNLAETISGGLINDMESANLSVAGATTGKSLSIGNINVDTVQDATEFLKELKKEITKRTGSRFL